MLYQSLFKTAWNIKTYSKIGDKNRFTFSLVIYNKRVFRLFKVFLLPRSFLINKLKSNTKNG